MTATQQPYDPHVLAGQARAVLSCPSTATLEVEGLRHLDDIVDLTVRDTAGVPAFSCPVDSALALAAACGREARLTLGADTASSLSSVTLTGTLRLRATGRPRHQDTPPTAHVVELVPASVAAAAGHASRAVPLAHFRSSDHDLNDGYLRRVVEHTNDSHPAELRHSVATARGLRPGSVAGAAIADLTRDGVEVHWIDLDGAHTHRLWFPRPARSRAELGALLSRELHSGLT
ncbi:DUF2470 domain-containing protein [Nocardioides pacificus]